MWKISEVKKKGLTRFKANYWLCVLVAVIVALISGGISGGGYRFGGSSFSNAFNKDGDKNDRFEKATMITTMIMITKTTMIMDLTLEAAPVWQQGSLFLPSLRLYS